MASTPVPVVFLVFNRPEHTARVFARIREARPAQLFVVADGPRADRPDDAEKCRQVRELVRKVDWPCELVCDFSETNLGSARRVPSGITNAFRAVEQAIILEDDCLPDTTFFPFCAELLERFRDEPRIGMIGGCTFRSTPPRGLESFYYSIYPHTWGWATWRRAWQMYDHTMSAARLNELASRTASYFPDRAERKYWNHVYAATAAGRNDAWDYRWTASLWAHDCLSVLPASSLVANIGFGPESTHTRDGFAPPAGAARFPLQAPPRLERDELADAEAGRRVFRLPSLATRLMRRARRCFT